MWLDQGFNLILWLEKCLGRIWLRTPGILFGLAVVFGLNFQIAYLPASHNHFRALSLKCQNQSNIKTRNAFFVLGLCCFWVLQQPQHRRLLDSHHLRGPSYCPLSTKSGCESSAFHILLPVLSPICRFGILLC
ncbi:hypothetical protein L3X38_005594 [Prunus dulcis]|uniref:Uncharacterized protein n=1 Tax=Prunus dulcis TaxID=3755 RepID=A0AAD4ZR21_PRUDU|nr:hypothetical protein L3X38_005594 [Prunus dulcis]